MKMCEGVEVQLGTRWRLVVSFKPRLSYPMKITPGTKCIRSCVGPRAGLDAVE
jgi:hypothetical protein